MRLTIEGCRIRQKRLNQQMQDLGVQIAVLGSPKHVLYFSGYEVPSTASAAVILSGEGRCTLVAPSQPRQHAADDLVIVESSFLSTLHLDHARRVAEAVTRVINGNIGGMVGVDKEESSAYLGALTEDSVDLSSVLFGLRRQKLEDELVLLRQAISVTEACYRRAREIIAPGINELDLYTELYRTACLTAKEKLAAMGNDFQCGSPGGPPRNRAARAGELYILDLGVVIGGYNADNARTFSVDGNVTPEQQEAWRTLEGLLEWVESEVRPGVSCKGLYQRAKQRLDRFRPDSFFHHLGHGVGLSPHERPNLNPHWNHIFEEGDFFTVEPGLYGEDLKGGIRLEENYRVTAEGVEKLTHFPLAL